MRDQHPAGVETKRRHWIYVLGGAELRKEARAWQEAKSKAGKQYGVIEARLDEEPEGSLTAVGNQDVVYIYARMRTDTLDAVGETQKSPHKLANHLRLEGLHRGHRVLKLFISRSGDKPSGESGSASYAERMYKAMKAEYPSLVVYGYKGGVSPQGFGGQKTAALGIGESLAGMTAESWRSRRLRAKENRVRFPPESHDSLAATLAVER